MLKEAVLVKRPTLPEGLRVVRVEFLAMEYLGTPHERKVTDGWLLVVFGDPQTLTPDIREQLRADGWTHFKGRNAGTFRKKITIRFED